MNKNIQIALAIGNSRYHWAWFIDYQLQSSWDTDYFTPDEINTIMSVPSIDSDCLELFPPILRSIIPQVSIYLCSVVPSQTAIWQQFPQVKILILADVPLLNLYPTLGIDRALSVLGAGELYGYPVLVIDGGTALTITGIDGNRSLFGGAILPGLKLQFQSLAMGTAALPVVELPAKLPPRWSNQTETAIAGGILSTITAGIGDFIYDWYRLFPKSQIIFTGGDGAILVEYLQAYLPINLASKIQCDRYLIFQGFSAILSTGIT